MNKEEIHKHILDIGKKMKKKQIYLLLLKSDDYTYLNDLLLYTLITEQKMRCLYVSLNSKAHTLYKRLEKANIDSKKIYFIDGCGDPFKHIFAKNSTCISGPHSLTELSLAITAATDTGHFDFLFFDSFSTILMYHELKIVQKFGQYMINKISDNNLGAVLLSLKEDKNTEKLIPILSQFCDGAIDLTK